MRALHHDLVTNVYSRLYIYYRDKHSLGVTRQYQVGGLEKHFSPTTPDDFSRSLSPRTESPNRQNYNPGECKVEMICQPCTLLLGFTGTDYIYTNSSICLFWTAKNEAK
jgi:hypothetical protein